MDFYFTEEGTNSRKLHRLAWEDIEAVLAPEEKAVIEALNHIVQLNLIDIDQDIIINLEKQIEDIQETGGKWGIGVDGKSLSAEQIDKLYNDAEEAYEKDLRRLRSRYQSRFPYAFLNPNQIKDENLKLVSLTQLQGLLEEFEKDDQLSGIVKKYEAWKKNEKLAMEFNKRKAQANRLVLLIQNKVFEFLLQNPKYEKFRKKYQQLKECESQPYFTK